MSIKKFSMVVAMDESRGIGKKGVLPWHLSADLKHFARLTKATHHPNTQNAVLMGRKTWESLPERFKPLLGRFNIVLSRQKDLQLPQGVQLADSLDHALQQAQHEAIETVFVIGGGYLFEEALRHPQCAEIHLTRLKGDFQCDTFLTQWEASVFIKTEESPRQEENGIAFQFETYRRKIEKHIEIEKNPSKSI